MVRKEPGHQLPPVQVPAVQLLPLAAGVAIPTAASGQLAAVPAAAALAAAARSEPTAATPSAASSLHTHQRVRHGLVNACWSL